MPVENEEPLPPVMREALGYPFYVFDEQQVPLELDPAYGDEFTRKYNIKLAKLAYDIAGLIKKIESPGVPGKLQQLPASGSTPNLQSILPNAASIAGARARPWSRSCGCMDIQYCQTRSCRRTKKNTLPRWKDSWLGASSRFTWWAQNTASFPTAQARSR